MKPHQIAVSLTLAAALSCVLQVLPQTTHRAMAAGQIDFEQHVLPIFFKACAECHGTDKTKGGLRLTNAEGIRKGGITEGLIKPGKSSESYLMARILGHGDEDRMPTDDEPLSSADVDLIREWIDAGAVMPEPEKITFKPGPAGLRRITAEQYRNVVNQDIGIEVDVELEPDEFEQGFASQGAYNSTASQRGLELFSEAAFQIARQVFSDDALRARTVGCQAKRPQDACVKSFLKRWAKVLWRRSNVTDKDLRFYNRMVSKVSQSHRDLNAGLEVAFAALLQSPNFLYSTEVGGKLREEAPPDSVPMMAYTPVQMANRMAFFLWNAAPDETLLQAAQQGELGDEASVRAHAERMLHDPLARQGVRTFFSHLLHLHELPNLARDEKLYPSDSLALREAMGKSLQASVEDLVFDESGDATRLFDTQTVFVNAALANLYGIKGNFSPDKFTKVNLAKNDPRVGILGMPAFLAINSIATRPSPTQRGVFIREKLLCQEVPPPPDNVSVEIPDDDVSGIHKTMRVKLQEHAVNPVCANCHRFFDPLGLALENFDALGAYRKDDRGLPIDTKGEIDGKSFHDAKELAAILREDPRASACLVKNLYTHATGHSPSKYEKMLVDDLTASFAKQGHNFRKLMVNVIASDGFRFATDSQGPADKSKPRKPGDKKQKTKARTMAAGTRPSKS